jgi:hypothetical protein
MLVNFGLNEGFEVGLKEEITVFSEAFNPDTKQRESCDPHLTVRRKEYTPVIPYTSKTTFDFYVHCSREINVM